MSIPVGRVLLVDDDKSMLWVLEEYLRSSLSCAVVGVGSVNEAHHLLREDSFDLVICDFHMDGETGLDLLQRLIAENIRLPFFLYTSSPNIREDSFSDLDYIFSVVQKPDVEGLLRRVSGALGRLTYPTA